MMKYCQGPKCHTYQTKDRIRGPKGDKHYETRKNGYFIMVSFVLTYVEMIGLIHLASEPLIISVELLKLKELTQVAHGISREIGEVMTIVIITLLMIYLASADQLLNNNTMMRI